MPITVDQRRARAEHRARAADAVVPQHLVVGRSTPAAAGAWRRRRTAHRVARAPFLGRARAGHRARPDGAARSRCSARTRPTRRGCTAAPASRRTPRTASTTTSWTARRPVNPAARAPRARCWYRVTVAGRARPPSCGCGCARRPADRPARRTALGAEVRRRHARRGEPEADEFYAALTPGRRSADEALVMRQAFAGLLWSKQFYHYDVDALAGRRPRPAAAAGRAAGAAATRDWRHFDSLRRHVDARQVGVPVVRRVGPGLPLRGAGARRPGVRQDQLLLLLPRMVPHPNGAAARLRVGLRRRQPAGAGVGRAARCSPSTAAATSTSSSRIFDKLLLNFTWWVNREDADGTNVFEGGFLGLDNIGLLDRSHLPTAARSSSPTPPAGWHIYALDHAATSPSCWPRTVADYDGPRASSSSSTSPPSRDTLDAPGPVG